MSWLNALIEIAIGTVWGFHWEIWIGVTLLLLVSGPIMAAVARPTLDPVAVIVALSPSRAVQWMFLGPLLAIVLFAVLVFSLLGIPVAVLLSVAFVLAGGLGYLAVALVLGDRLTRIAGREVEPWVAMVVGLVVLRLLRLVPFGIGATVHAAVVWFGIGAACALAWDLGWSFHRRRLPDEVQFAGEQLVEWDHVVPPPSGEAENGPPSP